MWCYIDLWTAQAPPDKIMTEGLKINLVMRQDHKCLSPDKKKKDICAILMTAYHVPETILIFYKKDNLIHKNNYN